VSFIHEFATSNENTTLEFAEFARIIRSIIPAILYDYFNIPEFTTHSALTNCSWLSYTWSDLVANWKMRHVNPFRHYPRSCD